MRNDKLFVVKFNIGYDDDFTLCKAFAGRLSAQQYVETEVKKLLKTDYNPSNGCWDDAWHYRYENALNGKDYRFEIEEISVEQTVILPELPFVENENLVLKNENKELRQKLGHVEGLIAAARCYLTMYDGGWQYDKEHVIENMHAARAILEDGKSGNAKINEMFENWLEIREKDKKAKNKINEDNNNECSCQQ